MSHQERADQILADDKAVRLARMGDKEVSEQAIDFVALDPRIEQGSCVSGTAMVWCVNRHPTRRIRATIKTNWIYDNRPWTEFTDHWIHDRSEIRIGCTFPGPSQTQRFDREIHSAVFAG